MKVYKHLYSIRDGMGEVLERLKSYFIWIGTAVTFFALMSPYTTVLAKDLEPIDLPAKYEESFEASKSASKQPNGSNTFIEGSKELVTNVSVPLLTLGGTSVFGETEEDLGYLPENKRFARLYGLTGVTVRSTVYAVYSQPYVDVGRHLAYEWVPGYADSQNLYAADIVYNNGYDMLMQSGILSFWQVTRNIAYLILIIVLVVAGFMIMFRHKINGQVMVTLYNSLPNILLSLVLITFSFAIVGLLIDLNSTVIYYFAMAFFPKDYWEDYKFIDGPFAGMENGNKALVGIVTNASWVGKTLSAVTIGGGILGLVGVVMGVTASVFSYGVIGLLIVLLFEIVLLWLSFKVYWAVISQFFSLLLNTIILPLVIAVGAIPGGQKGIANIFKKILKNLLSIQLITFFFNLAVIVSTNPDLKVNLFRGISMGGTIQNSDNNTSMMVRFFLLFYLMAYAAKSPKLLDDWIPTTEGKGAAEAANVKVPLIGSMFGK